MILNGYDDNTFEDFSVGEIESVRVYVEMYRWISAIQIKL
jgi:hypothetical protein